MHLLVRYQAGDCRAVWDELLARGAGVREPASLPEAEAVVRETMTRVRANVEAVIAGLKIHGFRFGVYPDGEPVPGYAGPLVPPAADVDSRIAELESLVNGPIPLSLAGFWRYVGAVALVGAHPEWPDPSSELLSDPLWVEGPEASIAEVREKLEDREREDEPLAAVIAPDALHKDNISGGEPYEIEIPSASADALLLHEGNDYYFVEYLRQALDWGGFPGFAGEPDAMPAWLDRLSEKVVRF